MRPKCVLVHGEEEGFVKQLSDLAMYLRSTGCEVEVLPTTLFGIFRSFCKTIEMMPANQPLLLVYSGHGSRMGWEGFIFYPVLALSLRRVKGDLIVINDTCYGFHFLKHLKRIRSPSNTAFIAPWDSEGVSYSGPVRDAIDYWPKGVVVEDIVKTSIHSTDDGDVEVPLQLRWGARFDHYFFPAQVT